MLEQLKGWILSWVVMGIMLVEVGSEAMGEVTEVIDAGFGVVMGVVRVGKKMLRVMEGVLEVVGGILEVVAAWLGLVGARMRGLAIQLQLEGIK